MPDPLLYVQATVAAAVASALIVLALLGPRKSPTAAWRNATCGIAITVGLTVGLWVESLHVAMPPASGLDRLLWIVIPAAVLIESIAAVPRFASRIAWLLRISLVLLAPRILLHGSVYLSDPEEWSVWQAALSIGVCWVLLATCWGRLLALARRSPGVSIPLSLCLALQCAAATVMMAGYLKGGEAAMPMVAALLGATLVVWAISRRRRAKDAARDVVPPTVLIGVGVISLFGVLFIGHFFGRVSGGRALAIGVAPLLCWATEWAPLRHRRPWIVGAIRLALVAVPLLVTLAMAKRDFDRDLAPLVVLF
ncbi:hypothetical protein Enr13x_35590 [Stieleria neptunia]|uniref:Uncharacterized protein n=1 Tax=Stieleria neptunia TaxID=2527979 RepID=A0A518HS84_9BACT|nr:hypothetical protein [Stieleria neptunia]QDV43702.1 hypothetical protein Enr13x_35590 [Stieleria neptunia]